MCFSTRHPGLRYLVYGDSRLKLGLVDGHSRARFPTVPADGGPYLQYRRSRPGPLFHSRYMIDMKRPIKYIIQGPAIKPFQNQGMGCRALRMAQFQSNQDLSSGYGALGIRSTIHGGKH
ncbi:hypothetical protein N7467_011423 [Penicillium canescens]|nr:hypothetical protein N7467_011423 [Penicillium canescens]